MPYIVMQNQFNNFYYSILHLKRIYSEKKIVHCLVLTTLELNSEK